MTEPTLVWSLADRNDLKSLLNVVTTRANIGSRKVERLERL